MNDQFNKFLVDLKDFIGQEIESHKCTNKLSIQKAINAELRMKLEADPTLEIEYYDEKSSTWIRANKPAWFNDTQYRIKPLKIDEVYYVSVFPNSIGSHKYKTLDEAIKYCGANSIGIIELVVDATTKMLKSSVVVN